MAEAMEERVTRCGKCGYAPPREGFSPAGDVRKRGHVGSTRGGREDGCSFVAQKDGAGGGGGEGGGEGRVGIGKMREGEKGGEKMREWGGG